MPYDDSRLKEFDSYYQAKSASLRERAENWAVAIGLQKVDGLCFLVEKQELSEEEFAKRLHRIYAELNMAWNSRKDKTFAVDEEAISRRRLFPYVFATGSWNMWK